LLQLVGAVQRSRTIPPPLPQTVQSVEGAPLSATTPACPFCGSAMIIRTARRGANPGSKFWGCSRYSAGCRGTRAC
jgi:restriction system protein